MLQLQRASAGSGKTYTLAKKFIWFFITIKEENGRWRLRNKRETADALSRILAITFTNKATNEMKLRIVEKLADLSRANTEYPLSAEEQKKINYLLEFSKALGVDYREVGIAASHALSVLLNEYSDFKVSTIDSFFQTILRTFAYESNLNDTYQVEIDSEYLSRAAIDATLDAINNASVESMASFWIKKIMQEEAESGSTGWNMFAKKESRHSIYTKLRQAIQKLDNEDFKKIRDKLDSYFMDSDQTDPLATAYAQIKSLVEAPMIQALSAAKEAASQLRDIFDKKGYDVKQCVGYFGNHISKIPTYDIYTSTTLKPLKPNAKNGTYFKNPDFGPDSALIQRLTETMTSSYQQWLDMKEDEKWKHWKIYAPLLPYLGLIGEARNRIKEYLETNNTIQLGETNSMLRRIIGDDDTPFVYERLGSRLNNYLIDEFQDTSSLQWENLRPLLKESNARGEDNLIIGDAKQSIYRFRNADPSLITQAVPDEFPYRLDAGMTKADNTNWRSDRTIVEFNNFFFTLLANRLQEKTLGGLCLTDLYSNVAQFPSKRERNGYVEINFLSIEEEEKPTRKNKNTKDLDANKKSRLLELSLMRMGPLVEELLERGYRQRDIAFLVDTKDLAKGVIDALVAYNTSLPAGARRIEFISEESLLVSSSEAVGIIISVLEKMVSGTNLNGSEKNGDHRKWNDIRCNFNFYALRHPEKTIAEQIRGFLSEESPVEAINDMLKEMQTVALPALVEAITENFIPEEMRRSQAVFIAGFQDLVLEYANSHAADLSSFLDWWHLKGAAKSISSPEGTDAVQIMTIHKSKGLEFPCVILPFADKSFLPSATKSEWRWVEPAKCFEGMNLPKVVPVETTSALIGTVHEKDWNEYTDLHIMDNLNKYYVAFTRAVNELYIFTPDSSYHTLPLGKLLRDICGDTDASIAEIIDMYADSNMEIADFILPDGSGKWENDAMVTYGEKPIVRKDSRPSEAANGQHTIEEYGVDSSSAILHYVEGEDEGETTLLPEASDPDPRSEGNLLHAIMEKVRTADDLHKSVLQMRMRGLIDSQQAIEWEEMLSEAMHEEKVSEWFSTEWKVMNERDILFPRGKNRRPDRIMISRDNKKAVVVDYKFGLIPSGNSHRKQVADYIKALEEVTRIHDIEGYVWYVRENTIEKV